MGAKPDKPKIVEADFHSNSCFEHDGVYYHRMGITWSCPICGRRSRVSRKLEMQTWGGLPIQVFCKLGHESLVAPKDWIREHQPEPEKAQPRTSAGSEEIRF